MQELIESEVGAVSTNSFPSRPTSSGNKLFVFSIVENGHPIRYARQGYIRAKDEVQARVKISTMHDYPMTILGVWDVV